jgi:F-type H+-transporting ATPase subunit gamma
MLKSSFALLALKPQAFFNSYGGKVVASIRGLGDKPELHQVIGCSKSDAGQV